MQQPQLRMERRNLADIPEIQTPPGYILRNFEPGDEEGLARVYASGDLGTATAVAVRRTILAKPWFLPERVFVVAWNKEVVGTAACWQENWDPGYSYLYMLGVLPEHRGKRLGVLLATTTLRRSRDEGYRVQRLVTDDPRDAAIRLYLDLGYFPLYSDPSHPPRWQHIAVRLQRPDALARARRLPGPWCVQR